MQGMADARKEDTMANTYAAFQNGFGGHFDVQVFGSHAERKQYLEEHGSCDAISSDEARDIATAERMAVVHNDAALPKSWRKPREIWVPRWLCIDREEDEDMIYDLIPR